MRLLFFLAALTITLAGCSAANKTILLTSEVSKSEAKRVERFWLGKHDHLIQLSYVGDYRLKDHSSSEQHLYELPLFQAAQSNQGFRPDQLHVGNLAFQTPKGQIVPNPPLSDDWRSILFGKEQPVALTGTGGDTLFQTALYLPQTLEVSIVNDHQSTFSYTWTPDSGNASGIHMQFTALRGPQTGHGGNLKSFNWTFVANDADGKAIIPYSELPEWVWEDPEHTSFSLTVYRRNTVRNKMSKGSGRARVVCTQGVQYEIFSTHKPQG